MTRICVIGMGRVGLTLALSLASAGFKVTGVERDGGIVASLNRGQPHFYEKGLEALLKKCLNHNLIIGQKVMDKSSDAYIISVGTPIDKKSKKVILQPLIRAAEEIAGHIKEGDTVILRSTVPVGTTRNTVLPLLKKHAERFYLAFCPERTIEGRALLELKELPQIVGGLDEDSVDKAVGIFSKITATTVRVESLEAAEMIKLIDNTYRDVNFALANEIALVAERIGLNAAEVIKAANLGYHRNNVPLPGFVGGACLAKDPHIFHDCSGEFGYAIRLAKLAREVNESLPWHVAEKLKAELSGLGKDIAEAKVLIAGIAFKGQPENDDLRDSPALDLVECLANGCGCKKIYGHDFVISPEEMTKAGIKPCSLPDGFKDADCVIFANNHHKYYDLDINSLIALMHKPAVFYDGWHIFDPNEIRAIEGVIYSG